MIASGEKKEEYREIKPYWINRLLVSAPYSTYSIEINDKSYLLDHYKYICFHNGYTSECMIFSLIGCEIGKGKHEWGVPQDKEVFILKLGRRIK